MSLLRKIPMQAFYVTIAALAIGLAFWQYDLANGDRTITAAVVSEAELQFKLSDGSSVQIPDDTTRLTVVVFWSAASERSLLLAGELIKIAQSQEYDSVFDFYAVNIGDSPEAMRGAVDFDNTDLPYGYEASGRILDANPVRTLPLTLMLDGGGEVVAKIDGYEEGALAYQLEQYLAARKFLGNSSGFKFRVN